MFPNFIKYNTSKFQRLGLMKILIAFLHPQRRSESKSFLVRKITNLLFQNKSNRFPFVESLIRASDSSSWNYRIRENDLFKLLDWGRIYGLVGSGNQITEQGLLLRHIMGKEAIESILKDCSEINPFNLTLTEKLFFLFTHMEMDTPIFFIIKRLADVYRKNKVSIIRGIDADIFTCHALYDTYNIISDPRFRNKNFLIQQKLKNLIGKMAKELRITKEIPLSASRVAPSPLKPRVGKGKSDKKVRTIASDSEAIPRFEFLTDIGFLSKNFKGSDYKNKKQDRMKWQYNIEDTLLKFSDKLPENLNTSFFSSSFAHSASIIHNCTNELILKVEQFQEIAEIIYNAYEVVKRQFGHTPLKTVAIYSMLNSLADKKILEMKDIHKVFIKLKEKNIASDSVKFAAGNSLDKMFININSNFLKLLEVQIAE